MDTKFKFPKLMNSRNTLGVVQLLIDCPNIRLVALLPNVILYAPTLEYVCDNNESVMPSPQFTFNPVEEFNGILTVVFSVSIAK